MPKINSRLPSDIRQLSLDELLEQNPKEFVNYQVDATDIGGQLLPLISQGLYTNPLHCIREYVQNSVDAGAKQVKVQITANAVIIHDDGTGMNAEDLREARRFGMSPKSLRQSVGFRGIGIYSGYNLCNRLLITSKRSTENFRYILEFDFGAMKRQLAADEAQGRQRTPLADLIESNSRFTREEARDNTHFTSVILEEISDFHINQLADRTSLRDYILHNLPVDFDEQFTWRSQINDYLEKRVPGFRAVKIVLESPGAAREVVAKPAISELDEPQLEPIVKVVNGKTETIGQMWACLRKPENGARGKIPEEFKNYRGFVYKVKGFTVGTNNKLKGIFGTGGGTLYDWYTGEIYVTDPDVVPNAERNDFEANAAREALDKAVFDQLKQLQTKAANFQAEGRAVEKFRSCAQELEHIMTQVSDGTHSVILVYRDLSNIVEDLDAQVRKLPAEQKTWGQDLLKRAKDLKRQVGGDIDNPQPARNQRKAAARRRNQEKAADEVAAVSPQTKPTLTPLQKESATVEPRLLNVFEEGGWSLSEDCSSLVEIIDRSLTDVLGRESEEYRSFLADVAEKLSAELAGQ